MPERSSTFSSIGADARYGFELKFSEAPSVTRSMRIAIDDLKLEHLWIVTPGPHRYQIDDTITVLPLAALADEPGLPTQ